MKNFFYLLALLMIDGQASASGLDCSRAAEATRDYGLLRNELLLLRRNAGVEFPAESAESVVRSACGLGHCSSSVIAGEYSYGASNDTFGSPNMLGFEFSFKQNIEPDYDVDKGTTEACALPVMDKDYAYGIDWKNIYSGYFYRHPGLYSTMFADIQENDGFANDGIAGGQIRRESFEAIPTGLISISNGIRFAYEQVAKMDEEKARFSQRVRQASLITLTAENKVALTQLRSVLEARRSMADSGHKAALRTMSEYGQQLILNFRARQNAFKALTVAIAQSKKGEKYQRLLSLGRRFYDQVDPAHVKILSTCGFTDDSVLY